MLLTGAVGVAIAVVVREPLVETAMAPAPVSQSLVEEDSAPTIVLPTPEEIADPHLSWADLESERVIEEHLAVVDRFFKDAKKRTRPFADKALGWGSKWRLVADYVPFTGEDRHEAFVRGKFEQHVFSASDLEHVIKQVVSSYIKHIESVEGQMLVRIRADVADLPSGYVMSEIDDSQVHASYQEAISSAVAASGSSLRGDVATEVVSLITGEVLTQGAVRMGVSAGVLGAGAASSWTTLGIGFAVGVIVDQIITGVWDWYADPRGELAFELNAKLIELNHIIVDGSHDVTGLRDRLHDFARERAGLRKTAVLSLLQPQQEGA
jgi:hypothetical protein